MGVTNPKGLVIFLAFLPGFVDHSAGEPAAQLLALGIVCIAVAVLSDGSWAVAAGSVGRWLARSDREPEWLRLAGGTALIALGAALAVAAVTSGS